MTTELRLPWPKPPVNANDRDHWRVKADKVAAIRLVAKHLAICAGLSYTAERIEVGLTYVPRDKRRRDADNLVVPLMKALVDGLVDAHVVADDDDTRVTRTMPRILLPDGDPRLVLTVRKLP